MTVWMPIVGYEGRYEVSDSGQVRRTRDGRVLTHHLIGPYHRVCLWNGKRSNRFMVHRLVARAFVGPCPDYYEVNHKNGDPSDNAVQNLEYVTASENVRHSFDELGRQPARGESHGSAVLSEELVRALRAEHAQGATAAALARRLGIDPSTVQRAVNGTTWRHI